MALLFLAITGVMTATFGTTFVVLSTGSQVVLGIDTKQGHQRGGRIVEDASVCKVITRKSSAYAISGFTGVTRLDDLYPVINRVATDDLEATMLAVASPAEKFLSRHVPKIGSRDLELLAPNGKPITVIIGIGFKRTSIVRDVSFYVNPDRTIKAVPELFGNPASYYDERAAEITGILPPFWYNEDDLAALLRKLMDAGIKANPADSGYPISIVTINRYGLDQPERPEICRTMDAGPIQSSN
jgi:hypothetical protein